MAALPCEICWLVGIPYNYASVAIFCGLLSANACRVFRAGAGRKLARRRNYVLGHLMRYGPPNGGNPLYSGTSIRGFWSLKLSIGFLANISSSGGILRGFRGVFEVLLYLELCVAVYRAGLWYCEYTGVVMLSQSPPPFLLSTLYKSGPMLS